MTIDHTNGTTIGAIGEALRNAGVGPTERSKILSQVKAAVADAHHDHSRTPLGDHLSAEESRQLSYNQNLAICTARRLGVVLNPGKPISASAFSAAARGRGRPEEIMAAKYMAAAAGLMHDD